MNISEIRFYDVLKHNSRKIPSFMRDTDKAKSVLEMFFYAGMQQAAHIARQHGATSGSIIDNEINAELGKIKKPMLKQPRDRVVWSNCDYKIIKRDDGMFALCEITGAFITESSDMAKLKVIIIEEAA